MKKKFLFALLTVTALICCALGFTACGSGNATIYYSEIEENGEVIAYSVSGSSRGKNIKIPSVYNDKPVTAIGEYAFEEGAFLLVHLESITIPDSVTQIGSNAFWGCHYLTDIYFGGTKEQWEAIDKGDDGNDWLADAGAFNGIGWCFIHCSDEKIQVAVDR